MLKFCFLLIFSVQLLAWNDQEAASFGGLYTQVLALSTVGEGRVLLAEMHALVGRIGAEAVNEPERGLALQMMREAKTHVRLLEAGNTAAANTESCTTLRTENTELRRLLGVQGDRLGVVETRCEALEAQNANFVRLLQEQVETHNRAIAELTVRITGGLDGIREEVSERERRAAEAARTVEAQRQATAEQQAAVRRRMNLMQNPIPR